MDHTTDCMIFSISLFHFFLSFVLERSWVGALEGDAGVVDEDVAPPVLLLDLRGESLLRRGVKRGQKQSTEAAPAAAVEAVAAVEATPHCVTKKCAI